MRRQNAPVPPPEVIQALEIVERATSPVHIGREYQTLLDWRRAHSAPGFTLNVLPTLWTLTFIAFAVWGVPLLAARFSLELSKYWEGFFVGAAFSGLIVQFTVRAKQAAPPTTVEERIEAAIERWRHAVPAMQELPR